MYRYAKFTTMNDSADIVVRKDAVDAVYSNGEDKTHSIICLTGGKTYEVQESVAEVMSKLRGRWYEQPAENLKLDDITLCLVFYTRKVLIHSGSLLRQLYWSSKDTCLLKKR